MELGKETIPKIGKIKEKPNVYSWVCKHCGGNFCTNDKEALKNFKDSHYIKAETLSPIDNKTIIRTKRCEFEEIKYKKTKILARPDIAEFVKEEIANAE
jgi:hypothetical protein